MRQSDLYFKIEMVEVWNGIDTLKVQAYQKGGPTWAPLVELEWKSDNDTPEKAWSVGRINIQSSSPRLAARSYSALRTLLGKEMMDAYELNVEDVFNERLPKFQRRVYDARTGHDTPVELLKGDDDKAWVEDTSEPVHAIVVKAGGEEEARQKIAAEFAERGRTKTLAQWATEGMPVSSYSDAPHIEPLDFYLKSREEREAERMLEEAEEQVA